MERVFFPFDAELKTELDKIKLDIQGEQNGMAARAMGPMSYKKNYGVSYVVLRRIAGEYQPSQKLANCLWNIGYRETMLIALLLFPKNKLTEDETIKLIDGMHEMELAEFASRDLLCQLPYANNLVNKVLEADSDFSIETAYLLAGRLLENDRSVPAFAEPLLTRLDADLALGKPTIAKAVSNFLKQLGIYAQYTEKVMAVVEKMSASGSLQQRWVAEEVRTFVEYTEEKK